MRTDTRTFRDNAFKSLRRQGINSAKAKRIVSMLAYQFSHHGYPVLPDTTTIHVSIDAEDQQSVAVVNEGLVTLHLDRYTLREMQPLVNCTPTARQVEIGDMLEGMITDVYSAINEASRAYDTEFGAPHTEADYDAQNAFIQAFPAVAQINARYDALKAESLEINPNVSAFLVDPDKASHWYEWVRDAHSYRPNGFMTLAMVEADMKKLPREILDEAA